MKRFVSVLCVLLSLALVLPLSGCSNEPKEITLLTWKDYVPEQILKDFTESSGIKVNVVTAETNEDMLGMIEKDPSAYDLAIVADYAADKLVQKKLLAEIDTKDMENYKYVSDGYKSKYYDPDNKYTVPYSTAGILLAYDKTKVPFEITSFAQLLDPALKNTTSYVDDANAIAGIANMILGESPDKSNDTSNMIKIVKKMADSIYSADSETPEEALANGEASVGVMFTSQLGYATAANPNLEIVYPKEGFIYSIDVCVIPSGAKAPKNAGKLIDYMQDPMVNGKIMPEINCSTTNTSAVQFMEDTYRNSKGYNIDPSKAGEGVLFRPLDEESQKKFNYIQKKYFKEYHAEQSPNADEPEE